MVCCGRGRGRRRVGWCDDVPLRLKPKPTTLLWDLALRCTPAVPLSNWHPASWRPDHRHLPCFFSGTDPAIPHHDLADGTDDNSGHSDQPGLGTTSARLVAAGAEYPYGAGVFGPLRTRGEQITGCVRRSGVAAHTDVQAGEEAPNDAAGATVSGRPHQQLTRVCARPATWHHRRWSGKPPRPATRPGQSSPVRTGRGSTRRHRAEGRRRPGR